MVHFFVINRRQRGRGEIDEYDERFDFFEELERPDW